MITIISDDAKQDVGKQLFQEFLHKGINAEYISITDVNVKPCYSCGGCTYKTFGKCVVRDDGDWIYPKLIRSDKVLVVTPIAWGSYSFQTKRVMDKIALIGDRYYHVKKKEIVKSMQGDLKALYAVGIKDNCSKEEKEVFKGLVAENIKIMDIQGNYYVTNSKVDNNEIIKMVEEISL